MSAQQRIVDVDRDFMWRYAGISAAWLSLFTVIAILLVIFSDTLDGLFF